jgi:LMBR1 domain-containing protein 1
LSATEAQLPSSDQITANLAMNREKYRALHLKYMSTAPNAIPKRDKKEMESLKREESFLERRQAVMERSNRGFHVFVRKIKSIMRPFEVVFGVVFLLLTLLVVVSMLLTSIDRAAHSFCGPQCGYILEHPEIFNPLNTLFLGLSKVRALGDQARSLGSATDKRHDGACAR